MVHIYYYLNTFSPIQTACLLALTRLKLIISLVNNNLTQAADHGVVSLLDVLDNILAFDTADHINSPFAILTGFLSNGLMITSKLTVSFSITLQNRLLPFQSVAEFP
jgi:hypothetical protein